MSEYVSHRVNLTFDEFGCKAEFDYSEFIDNVAREVNRRINQNILDQNAELLGRYGYMKVDDASCWFARYGTPERTAQTIIDTCNYDCQSCPYATANEVIGSTIPCHKCYGAEQSDYDKILAWLKGSLI